MLLTGNWRACLRGSVLGDGGSARIRDVDASRVERVLFGLVASRALAPSSKLEATRWFADDGHIDGLEQPTHTDCYRAMDFLLETLPEFQEQVFFTAADLLSLDVDVIFFDYLANHRLEPDNHRSTGQPLSLSWPVNGDTTSTYFELDFEDGELDDTDGDGEDPCRLRGHSKDARDDLPQVVIGMAVTTGGLPVRLWVWPGDTADTQTPQSSVRLRTIWPGGGSTAPCGSWMPGSRARTTARSSPRADQGSSSRRSCGPPNTRSSRLDVGRAGSERSTSTSKSKTSGSVTGRPAQQRFIMVRNLQAAEREAHTRTRLVELLQGRIAGSDELEPDARAELRGRIREKPGLWRYLRVTSTGLLRVDKAKIPAYAKLDGKTLLRTSDLTLDADDIARSYKALQDVELLVQRSQVARPPAGLSPTARPDRARATVLARVAAHPHR